MTSDIYHFRHMSVMSFQKLSEGLGRTIFDSAVIFEIIRRLSTPFRDTKQFKLGLIDDKGNWTKPKSRWTPQERAEVTLFDVLVINIKKLLGQVTGSNNITPVVATLYLLKERLEDSGLSGFVSDEAGVCLLAEMIVADAKCGNYKTLLESEAPTNVSDSGNMVNPNIERPEVPMTMTSSGLVTKLFKSKTGYKSAVERLKGKPKKKIVTDVNPVTEGLLYCMMCEETGEVMFYGRSDSR